MSVSGQWFKWPEALCPRIYQSSSVFFYEHFLDIIYYYAALFDNARVDGEHTLKHVHLIIKYMLNDSGV